MTALPPVQTLAHGAAPSQKSWSADLGFANSTFRYPLDQCFGILAGMQNTGKSFIFQRVEDAFIFNLDLSSTVTSPAPATIWPGLSPDGGPINVDKKPLNLDHQAVETVIAKLVFLAEKNLPRPKMVVFDTLNTFLRLVRAHVIATSGKARWEDLHGPAAYDKLYETIVECCMRLRRAGYGVWLLVHLSRSLVELTETTKQEVWELAIPPGLYQRLSALVEWTIPLVTTKSIELRKETFTPTGPGGKPLPPQTKETAHTITKRVLALADPKFANVLKVRAPQPMPDIDITNSPNPWETLKQEHERFTLPAKQP